MTRFQTARWLRGAQVARADGQRRPPAGGSGAGWFGAAQSFESIEREALPIDGPRRRAPADLGAMLPPMFALLLACTHAPDPVDSSDTDTPDDTPLDSLPTVIDTSEPDDTAEPDEADPNCADLYDPDVILDVQIEITDADWAALQADYDRGEKEYHPIVFRYGDEVVDNAMIRLKGNPDFSWYAEKMQFVIAFNEVDTEGRFHGLRKLSLDASWYEPTLVRDRVAWQVMRRQGGLPYACANSAMLTINGQYYGAYTNIEYLDHEWLERSFGKADATGTLWKYGYDPVSNADASDGSAIDAMNRTSDPDTLSTLGDLDEWLLEFAAEAVLGDDDGYWCCNHNYYLYEHPTRGILFVPWDFDDDFDVMGYDADPIYGYDNNMGLFRQSLFLALTTDPVWGPKYVDAVEALNEAMDPETTLADLDAWADQISDALETDPTRSIGWEEHLTSLERMRLWIPQRHAFVNSWVSCQRGGTEDADGDGFPVCEDPNDTDATVFPDAPEACNGVDDDADGWIDDPDDVPTDPVCDDCVRHDYDDRHFLLCRNPRTNEEAQANCEARGGNLGEAETTGEYYFYFFYTWPILEPWWTEEGVGLCGAWDESRFSSTLEDCDEAHPSVCVLDE